MIAKATTTEKTLAATNGTDRVAANLITQLPLRDVVWAAMEKVAGKQRSKGEPLVDGSKHVLSFDLQGLIDGNLFRQSIDSVVTVGHAQNRSSSATPGVPELVAYLFSKLNRTTQQRLLTDIPLDFAGNGCELPESNPALLQAVQEMLAALRSTRRVEVRAPIRCQFMAVE